MCRAQLSVTPNADCTISAVNEPSSPLHGQLQVTASHRLSTGTMIAWPGELELDTGEAAADRYEFEFQWRGKRLVMRPDLQSAISYVNDYAGTQQQYCSIFVQKVARRSCC